MGFFGGGGGGCGGGAGKKSSMFATSAVKAKGKESSKNSIFKNSRASNASCRGEAGGAKKKKSVFKTTSVGNKRNSEKTLSSFYPVKKRKSQVTNVMFGRDQQAEPEDKEDNGGTEGVGGEGMKGRD
ncbi:hypothetical protein TrRE_jg13500 [Triparma retinervis]|uniref:Uncharacterized protein n=1 Tax=Triparma retinervis TaxID=2557542 RepID=A0A9W7A2S1_9STRA|nr:hypothetical protein TrRE_jg13500 [Triparma retinervis]